jgi:hypothetical protein
MRPRAVAVAKLIAACFRLALIHQKPSVTFSSRYRLGVGAIVRIRICPQLKVRIPRALGGAAQCRDLSPVDSTDPRVVAATPASGSVRDEGAARCRARVPGHTPIGW